jgi:hypothetical protein
LPCLKNSAGLFDEEVRCGNNVKDIHNKNEKMNMTNGMQLWIGIHHDQDGIQVRPYFQDKPPFDKRKIADFGWDGQIDVHGPFNVPTQVVLQMAYDDYSPLSQGTPCRVESVLCASDDKAETLANKLREYVDRRYPEHADLWSVYPDTSHTTCNPATAARLVDKMMGHYLTDNDAEQ